MQLAISILYNLLFLTVSSDKAKLQWPFDLSSRNNLFYYKAPVKIIIV